mgnify:CR=1 FL=1
MKPSLPSANDVRLKLADLSAPQLRALASSSGVPFHTLLKVRSGETANPGLETVRKFLPLIPRRT